MTKTILKVEGMMCNGCENRIQNILKNIEGVKNVIANHQEKTVTVITEETISKKILQEEIENIGFSVIEKE